MRFEDHLLLEKNPEFHDTYMDMAGKVAKQLAKDIGKMERVSEKMLQNEIYRAILKATFTSGVR